MDKIEGKSLKSCNQNFPECDQFLEPIFQMQLWVKDNSILNHIFPKLILLYSCGKTCIEFFNGVQPCNLYLEENKKKKFQAERYIRKMCKFNVSVDANVERI